MDWLFIGQAVACGCVMGFLIAFSGVGGGVLVIPALSFFFGLPVSAAVGTASAYTALTKVGATFGHWRDDNINFALFWRFLAGAAPGAVLTAAVINALLNQQPHYKDSVQESLKILVIAAIAASLFFIVFVKKGKDKNNNGGGNDNRNKTSVTMAASGFGIGMIMGATGIGGGVLIVPALLAFGESPKRVVGTSIITALALSALSAAVYAGGGQVQYALMLWMLAGAALGVPPGRFVLNRLPDVVVRRALIVMVSVALAMMLIV